MHYTFKTRKEAMEFLAKYNFKYYVPRLDETGGTEYSIETTDSNKIYYCSTPVIENGLIVRNECFYYYRHVYKGIYPLASEGEKHYRESLERERESTQIEIDGLVKELTEAGDDYEFARLTEEILRGCQTRLLYISNLIAKLGEEQ